ncbi:MAG TPA: potassium channel family protein [Gaiellaceae bacterium]|nr:potassium channel family protein [Gaiellaceae bacterium]
MRRRPGEHWTRFAARVGNAFGLVLLLVIGIYVLSSLVSYSGWGGVVISAAIGTCAVVALVSADAPHGLVRWAAILATVAVGLAVVSALGAGSRWIGAAALVEAALLAVAALEVLGTVLTETEVGFRTILGAISVYVILGLLFTFVYFAVARLQGGLFFGTPTKTGDYLFFSVTTLTTTGYGDLVPAAQPGRLISEMEMLTGQIFLVTLIAGLVSLWRPGGWARRVERKR